MKNVLLLLLISFAVLTSHADVIDTPVSVSNFPTSYPITTSSPITVIQSYPSPVPVAAASLPLPTNAAQETGGNLAAIAASLAGTINAFVSGTVAVSNFPASYPITVASPLPVTFTNTSIAVTGAPTPAPAIRLWDGTNYVTVTSNALKVDGSAVTQPVSAASLPLPSGAATSANQTTANTSLSSIDSKLTSPLTVSGTVAVTGAPTPAPSIKLWDGTNTAHVTSGNAVLVDASATTQPVSGTFWQATQPVSGTFFQATQPVSFSNQSVNVSQMNGVTTSMDQGATGTGTQRVVVANNSLGTFRMWDGTNIATVTAANALKTDGSAVTQPVSGTFWQATQPISGSVTAIQATGTNLHVVVDSAPTTAVTGPLTDAQLRASPVPVQINNTAALPTPIPFPTGQKTMANSLPVTLASDQTNLPPLTTTYATGTITSAGGESVTVSTSGMGSVSITAFSDNVAVSSLSIKISFDGSTYVDLEDASCAFSLTLFDGNCYQSVANINNVFYSTVVVPVTSFKSLRVVKGGSITGTVTAWMAASPYDIFQTGGMIGTNYVSQDGAWTSATHADISTNGTASATSLQAGGVYFSATPTPTPGKAHPLSLDGNANLKVNVANTPAVTGSGNFTVVQATGTNLHAVLDASSAVIGHVINDASSAVIGHTINDTGSTTAVTGNVAITAASGAIASGALASGSVASGAVASGAVASGAFAPGSIASGAIVAGAVAAGATSFVKLEDVASADGDAGVPAMAILKATPADTAGTDGDYQMLEMKNGRLWASTILEAGSAVIGHVITDATSVTTATLSAETTKVIGTVNQGTSPWVGSTILTTGSAQIGHLEANQSVNTAQINGVTTLMDNGVTGTGAQRVTVSNNSLGTMRLWDGTNIATVTASNALKVDVSAAVGHVIVDSGALNTNQSTNIAQMNGVTTLMDNGVTGTGAQRVTVSNNSLGTFRLWDGTTIAGITAGNALKTDASATTQPVSIASLPSGAVTNAGTFAVQATLAAASITGSNPCMNPTATIVGINGSTSGTAAVQIIAASGSTKIYVCAINITGVSGTTPTFSLVTGTGSNCVTGQAVFLGSWTTAANTIYSFVSPVGVTPASSEICYLDTGTTPIQRYNITYVQQ